MNVIRKFPSVNGEELQTVDGTHGLRPLLLLHFVIQIVVYIGFDVSDKMSHLDTRALCDEARIYE